LLLDSSPEPVPKETRIKEINDLLVIDRLILSNFHTFKITIIEYHICKYLSRVCWIISLVSLYSVNVTCPTCTDYVSAADDPMQQIPVSVRGSPSRGYDVEYVTRTPGKLTISGRQK